MPYVHPSVQRRLDKGDAPTTAGELTYLLTRQLQRYLDVPRVGGLCYEDLAVCLGALEGASVDFTDRVVLPYERQKREQHGDVWAGHTQ